jgi:3-oxoacyl-[acyl-carrier-protein] synthase-3
MADKIYIKDRDSFIIQEGRAVFRWATTALHHGRGAGLHRGGDRRPNWPCSCRIRRACDHPGASGPDPHRRQGNNDIITAGNTSSASIPLALSRMIGGELASGDKALLIGFGAGVCYAAQVIKLP